MTQGAATRLAERPPAREVSPVVRSFMPSVLGRVHEPDIGLAIWQRSTRLNLRVSATTLLIRPPFMQTVVGTPDLAARRLCHDLLLFHWPLYADFRRLASRFAGLATSPIVQMRFEHVTDDSGRKFHVDAVGLRLLCTYVGPATEWVEADGRVRRMATMEVAIFKGAAFHGAGPRVLHRSPPLSAGALAARSRLVLCIDAVA